MTVYGHGGATLGQMAYFFLIPEEKFACAILTNSDDGGIITAGVFSKAMELYFGAKAELPKPIEAPSEVLEEYQGRYPSRSCHAADAVFVLRTRQGDRFG